MRRRSRRTRRLRCIESSLSSSVTYSPLPLPRSIKISKLYAGQVSVARGGVIKSGWCEVQARVARHALTTTYPDNLIVPRPSNEDAQMGDKTDEVRRLGVCASTSPDTRTLRLGLTHARNANSVPMRSSNECLTALPSSSMQKPHRTN
jgi:hypothetical protein